MRDYAAVLFGCAIGSVVLVGADQNPAAPQATFRSGVNVVELDVSVLDRDRQPMRGLTGADFTVVVDGQPRPVVAFKAVDLPKPVPPSAPWIRDVAPDVATNIHPSGRVVVIMIDDGGFHQIDDAIDVRAVEKARQVARTAVNELGPDDQAAVVFTENNHRAQNFTTDRKRLLEAIDRAAIFPGPRGALRGVEGVKNDLTPQANDPLGLLRGSCSCGVCSIEALGRVSEALRSLPQQRKIVLYISVGIVVEPDLAESPQQDASYENQKLHCNLLKRTAMNEVFREAALSNVTIQSVDPKGLVVGQVGGNPFKNPTTLRVEFLRTIAETTGGRAVVNNNEMEQLVPAVLAESSSYYLLGVESPPAGGDGRFHEIRVTVNRPSAEVRTRNGYYDPTAKERKAMAANASKNLDDAIAGAVPKSDFPMDVTVSPFARRDGRKGEVAIVLGVVQPNDPSRRAVARTEPVDVVASAFAPETGRASGSSRQRLNVGWNASAASGGLYEVMWRLPLDPGRYELRIGVKTAGDRTASVYTYVDVPDFARDALSLSGIVLTAVPSPKLAPKGAYTDLMPVAPTARRLFRNIDKVGAFLRVYQGGSHQTAAVTITTRIVDNRNQQVSSESKAIEAASFTAARSFDYQFDLPVKDLPRGQYLLTVDVAAGEKTARRTSRFRISQ